MALTTRTLNNTGSPLYAPDGSLLVGATVTFTLVNARRQKIDVWDATTEEKVVGYVTATSDSSGEFTVELWPNDRGNEESYYLCTIEHADISDVRILGQVAESVLDLTLLDFFAGGDTLTAVELDTLTTHMADTTAHGITGSLNELSEALVIGGETAGDYTQIDTDGTLTYVGDATVWEDVVGSLIGRRLYSNTGTLDYDYDENCIVMQPNGGIADVNDVLIFNYQYPHKAKVDGLLKLHMHWEQDSAVTRTITVEYRVQSNGAAKATGWTQVEVDTNTNNVFAYTSGTLNQITALVSVDMTGASISSTVQFRVARTDSNSGNINVTFVDAHYEIDSGGSSSEYVK